MLKDTVSIPGISMMYVLNKSIKMKQPSKPPLFTPGQPCTHKCTKCEANPKRGCEECKKVPNYCKQCAKNRLYELLMTSMVGRPSIIFCWYHESGKTQIRNDVKICAKVVGCNVNSLYLYCSGQEMPCGKEQYVKVDYPNDMEELCNQVMSRELFGFFQVNIHVPDEIMDKFSGLCPLFVMDRIPDELIPSHMQEYQTKTGQKQFLELRNPWELCVPPRSFCTCPC